MQVDVEFSGLLVDSVDFVDFFAGCEMKRMSCPPLVEIVSDGPEIEIVSDGELSPYEGEDEAKILPMPVPNRFKEDLSDIRCCPFSL